MPKSADRRKAILGLGGPAATLLIVVAALWFVGRSEELLTRVVHTEHVMERTRDLELSSKEAESSVRAYVITQRAETKESYAHAAEETTRALAAVADLTRDNPAQARQVEVVRGLTEARLARYGRSVELVEQGRADELREGFDDGLRQSAVLREEISALYEAERALLATRHDAYRDNVRLYQLLLALATVVAVASGLYGQLKLRGDMRERELRLRRERQLTKELAESNAELEGSVSALARTNQELDQFAYVASHDLRAPLRALSSLLTWIEEDLGEGVSAETRENLALARGRVTRMEALIDGILDFARVGRGKLAKERVETRALVEELAIVAVARAAEREVVLEGDFPAIVTERVLLEQVLQNLLSNALKHAPTGPIVVRAHQADGRSAFTIRDDGPGIDPKYHERIFGFFQTLAPRDKVESTGIGLAVVKKLVEGRGGRVSVTSAPGEGAAFTFTWPP